MRKAFAVLLLFSLVLVYAAGRADAGVLPARQHVTLTKFCPPSQSNPKFELINVGNEAVIVTIVRHQQPVAGPYSLVPGQHTIVLLAGVPWQGPFFATFTAHWKGKLVAMSSKQFCACEKDQPDVTTTTTTAPRGTTTTVPTSTTSVPHHGVVTTTVPPGSSSTTVATPRHPVHGSPVTPPELPRTGAGDALVPLALALLAVGALLLAAYGGRRRS